MRRERRGWRCSLKHRYLRVMSVAMQTCMVWALDVFAVALIAAASELDSVSQSIMSVSLWSRRRRCLF